MPLDDVRNLPFQYSSNVYEPDYVWVQYVNKIFIGIFCSTKLSASIIRKHKHVLHCLDFKVMRKSDFAYFRNLPHESDQNMLYVCMNLLKWNWLICTHLFICTHLLICTHFLKCVLKNFYCIYIQVSLVISFFSVLKYHEVNGPIWHFTK